MDMVEQNRRSLASAAGWFLWIAGCTWVNIMLYSFNSDTRLVLGSGATEVAAGLFNTIFKADGAFKMVATYLIGFVGGGVYIALLKPASQGKMWAFIVGFILYALDSILNLLSQDWLGLAVHAWGIYSIFGGIMACITLSKIAAQPAMATASSSMDAPVQAPEPMTAPEPKTAAGDEQAPST